jgi:hypothetical protein
VKLLLSAVACWCVLGLQSVALAQPVGSDRPFRGLFGAQELTMGHSLGLSAVLVQAYDDNVTADVGGNPALGAADALGGYFTMLQTSADYDWRTRRVQMGLGVASALRYFSPVERLMNAGQSAALGVAVQLPKRTNLFVNQNVTYSPSYLHSLFPEPTDPSPGTAPTLAPDYTVDDLESLAYGTTASLSRGFTQRGTVGLVADYRKTDFTGATALRPGVTAAGLRGQFSRTMSRNTSFRATYRYGTGQFEGERDKTVEHGIDVGFDYARPLSKTREATFAFSLGTSTLDVPESTEVGRVAGRRYRLVGDVTFGYPLSRTWQLRAQYRRRLEYVAGLTEPVYADGFSSSVQGNFSPTFGLVASAGYSSGYSGQLRRASTFATYFGSVRVQKSLTSHLAAYGEYLYYYYDFSGSALLVPGMPRTLERNGARVGVTVWLTALQKR